MQRTVSAAVLAGGLGTRLQITVPDRQKVVAEVAGKPFLGYILKQLHTAGFASVTFCTGYHADQIHAAFGELFEELTLRYSHEHEPLGTGGAIRNALAQLPGSHILVLNGDSFCSTDLNAFLTWCETRPNSAALLLTRVEDTERYGRVTLEGERIVRFEEKGLRGPGLINAGIYCVPREMIEAIQPGKRSLEQELFPKWAAENALFGYQARVDSFIDIGTPDSYRAAETLFAERE
ncbi:MAG: nucleotidyltransferase family protein [Bdellovibrionota bacterium]